MRLNYKDAFATLLVAAIVVPYLGYLVSDGMPFVEDVRGMAAIGLVLGLAACAVGGRPATGGKSHRIASILGPGALILGIAALITRSAVLLAVLIATIVALWVLATLRHATGS